MPTTPKLSAIELADIIANGDEIGDAARRGVTLALDIAHEKGRTYPTIGDCLKAATRVAAPAGSVAAGWGYARDRDDPSKFLSARTIRVEPGTMAVFQTREALMAFTLWSLTSAVGPPWSYEYQNRPLPRPRQSTARRVCVAEGKSPRPRPRG